MFKPTSRYVLVLALLLPLSGVARSQDLQQLKQQVLDLEKRLDERIDKLRERLGTLQEIEARLKQLENKNLDIRLQRLEDHLLTSHDESGKTAYYPRATGRLILDNQSGKNRSVLINGVRYLLPVNKTHVYVPLPHVVIQDGDAVKVLSKWTRDKSSRQYHMTVPFKP